MQRPSYLKEIKRQFRIHPVCAILGPRQVGKTTLAKAYIHASEIKATFFDLENPIDLARLDNPLTVLTQLATQLIVIDEIQRRPDLFPILRVIVDNNKKHQFLILGSASRDLIRQSSETLAGRIGYLELPPFSLGEVHDEKRLWIRGGFPRAYLAESDDDSYLWRQSYIMTFVERDIPALGFQIPPEQIRRFWLMLAHYHGQIFNASEISRSLGVSDHTARRYLEILVGTFMVRQLTPWFENLNKRQVKSPKIYFRDSGILNALLGIQNLTQMEIHPRLGSFWEGFALEEITRCHQAIPEECYFWATQGGAELDLLLLKNGKKLGFEFKYTDAPRMTKSIQTAIQDLQLDHLFVIYPGSTKYAISEKVTAIGLTEYLQHRSED